jgi:hypothetical protein
MAKTWIAHVMPAWRHLRFLDECEGGSPLAEALAEIAER